MTRWHVWQKMWHRCKMWHKDMFYVRFWQCHRFDVRWDRGTGSMFELRCSEKVSVNIFIHQPKSNQNIILLVSSKIVYIKKCLNFPNIKLAWGYYVTCMRSAWDLQEVNMRLAWSQHATCMKPWMACCWYMCLACCWFMFLMLCDWDWFI